MQKSQRVDIIQAFDLHALKGKGPVAVEDHASFHPAPELFKERIGVTRFALQLDVPVNNDLEGEPVPRRAPELETNAADFSVVGGI